ncbi:DNA polymerase III, delta subunit [gamma proteobacterium HTCC5015]|nr:DNA polymerase III, delta subunit [gamma proteobacterium HTCC5015]
MSFYGRFGELGSMAKIGAQNIQQHLARGLQPVYLVAGDEPLQSMETVDAIRAAARQAGHSLREVFEVDRQFDWSRLLESGNSMSLFAEQRILEVRLPSGAPGKEGGKAIVEYCQRPADDAILLIQSGKIDKRSKNSAWFKALMQFVVVEVWPIKPAEIVRWIGERMASRGLQADRDAVRLVAQRVEGNMLAAAQEIEKLLLLLGPGAVTAEQVREAVANSARYNPFDLIDSALMGEKAAPRCVRMLQGLKGEGVQPPQVLAPLVNELRNLHAMALQVEAGRPPAAVMGKVWNQRKNLVGSALGRLSSSLLSDLLRHAAHIDRINKGAAHGYDAWLELQTLFLTLAGQPLALRTA